MASRRSRPITSDEYRDGNGSIPVSPGPPMNRHIRHRIFTAALLVFGICAAVLVGAWMAGRIFPRPDTPVPQAMSLPKHYRAVRQVGLVNDWRLPEVSGLVASRTSPGMFWVHNDSDDGPYLVAIGTDGRIRGASLVAGARNRDWEDIAQVRIRDTSFLVVAETGDNLACFKSSALLFIPEPVIPDSDYTTIQTRLARTVRFHYEDGPHDVEAMAIDPSGREAILIAKRTAPPRIYRLDLTGPDTGIRVAACVGTVGGIIRASKGDARNDPMKVIFGSQTTAAEISPDGRNFLLLTYRRAYLYTRSGAGTWAAALAAPPSVIEFGKLRQAEGACFASDGRSVFITSERRPSPLLSVALD